MDELEEVVERLGATKSPYLKRIFAGFGDFVDIDNPYHRNMIKQRLRALAVEQDWIPVALQHRFTLLELVECVEKGKRPWVLQVHDLVSDASGIILPRRGEDASRIKVIIHDGGLPVNHLLWP